MTAHDDQATYTVAQVERLLRSYFEIRSVLHGSSRPPMSRHYLTVTVDRPDKEYPLGANAENPGPFSLPNHARGHVDGKAKARAAEELHVSVIDLETALGVLSNSDFDLVYKYFIVGSHTLDQLCLERGVKDRGGMSQLLTRVLRRLTRVINYEQPT